MEMIYLWNTDLINQITLGTAAAVPIIVALVQMIKMLNFIPEKFAPFISILVGILIAFLLAHDSLDFSGNILAGILFGLAASGLYSGIKSSTYEIKQQKMQKLEKKNRLSKE